MLFPESDELRMQRPPCSSSCTLGCKPSLLLSHKFGCMLVYIDYYRSDHRSARLRNRHIGHAICDQHCGIEVSMPNCGNSLGPEVLEYSNSDSQNKSGSEQRTLVPRPAENCCNKYDDGSDQYNADSSARPLRRTRLLTNSSGQFQ